MTFSNHLDILSPEVKTFLKNNKIKLKGQKFDDIISASDKGHKTSKAKLRKASNNQDSINHLSVPLKTKKKTFGTNSSMDRSSSPGSPVELRMSISGRFSDLDSSFDDEEQKKQHSPGLKNEKQKAFKKKKSQLPDIEEKKSLQAKN